MTQWQVQHSVEPVWWCPFLEWVEDWFWVGGGDGEGDGLVGVRGGYGEGVD